MKNIAVILAGGVGKRMGLDKPKQFLKMAGKTVLEHTVDVFQKHPQIDEVAIVVAQEYHPLIDDYVERNCWSKVNKILSAGEERYLSSLSAIKAYETDDVQNINLIFHDAARPLINERIISDVCKTLNSEQAVDVVVPAIDTIVETDTDDQYIKNIPQRNKIRRGQTPQGFRWEVINKAYQIALQDKNFSATDDCGIVLKYLPEIKIALVQGDEANVKLTNPQDIYLLNKLFQLKSTTPDKKNFADFQDKVLVIFGGNSGIGADMAQIAKQFKAKVYVLSRSLGNVDVSDMNSVQKALDDIYEKEKRIDFVINAAAILCRRPILHSSLDQIKYIVNVNYLGVINTTLASYRYLKESSGQVLQFTSSSYTRGRRNYALYSSSKAAVVNFIQAVSEEWFSDGIRLNCINPQRTATPMRTANFGLEDPTTLLSSQHVAEVALTTLLNSFTGEVVDVKLPQ